MLLYDLLIYVVFAYLLSLIARRAEALDRSSCEFADDDSIVYSGHWNRYLTYLVIAFTIIGAIRWNVGSDCLSYAHSFRKNLIPVGSTEYIFSYMVQMVYSLGLHSAFGLGLMAFVQMFFITKSLQRYQYVLVFIPFALFGGRYWADMMGACRQMMAACIFMWALHFAVERRMVCYMATIFIASFIHRSVLLMLPVYFLPTNLRLIDRRILLCLLVVGCCVVGQTPTFASLGSYVESLAGILGYDHYANTLSDMLTTGYSKEKLEFGPMMLSYLLIPLYIIWFGPKLEEEFADRIPEFYLWYNLALFYACGYFLICNISHIFIRPMQFLSLAQMYMAALTLKYFADRFRNSKEAQLAFIGFCIVLFTNTIWDVVKASVGGNPYETVTYKLIFFHAF